MHKLNKLLHRNLCSSIPKMSLVFTQKLNPLLGENTWEFQDEQYDYHQEIARSSYADMLHDTERNKKYNDALALAINKVHSLGKKARVLDIGTGTGLLSMMAVQNGADSVVACEAFEPMSKCARQIVSLNGYGDKIKIVHKHSTDLTVGKQGDLPDRANILVTEVFDTELIGEGALNTFSHAQDKLLEPDSIVIPSSATIYAQVIESPLAWNWNKLNNFCSTTGETLIEIPSSIKDCKGAAAVHDIQLSQLPLDSFKEIASPQPIFYFDWSGKVPLKFDERNTLQLRATRDGTAQIVFMWWDLVMDTENEIILSCAPYWAHPMKREKPNLTSADLPWRDHWMQALYYLPQAQRVAKGQELNLVGCHDEFSLWFFLDQPRLVDDPKPICTCTFHVAHSRTRIGQLNDETRNLKYLSMIDRYVNSESTVLLISDGFYLGLAAAKKGARKVLYLDDNYMSTLVMKDFIKTNNLNNVEIVENIEALKKHKSFNDITLVLGQPYFNTTLLPWDSFYFGYLIQEIRELLPKSVTIAPKVAKLYGVVLEFKDLHKIRFPLETYGEIDLKPFDDLLMATTPTCDAAIEAQPLWEYPGIARSAVMEIAKIDIPSMFDTKIVSTEGTFQLEDQSHYNGVALWVDWDLNGDGETVISTGPVVPPEIGKQVEWDMHTRQGVRFMFYKSKNMIQYYFKYNIEKGQLNFIVC